MRQNIRAFRFAPQALKIIKAPRLFIEDVNHEITVIDQDPFRRLETFDAGRPRTAALQLFDDFIADGLALPAVRPRGDDEKISKAGDAAQVKHRQVERFFLQSSAQGTTYPLIETG